MHRKIFQVSLFGLLVCALLVTTVVSVFALSFSQPQGYVNDFANVIDDEDQTTLENKLTQLEEDTSIEIAVVTVDSLQDTTVEEYAVKLFESWEIGKKELDNGILFLIAPSERKVRIEVGYGLEPRLNDAKAGRILDNNVLPYFKADNYSKGIVEGTLSIIESVTDEQYAVPETDSSRPGADTDTMPYEALLFLPFLVFVYSSSFLARTKSFWAGGVIGAISGVIAGLIFSSLLIGVFASIGMAVLGLLLDFILSRTYKERKKKGLPNSFFNSWGGFSSGSTGSSGGGFSGFGGGSSGGGGASRGW